MSVPSVGRTLIAGGGKIPWQVKYDRLYYSHPKLAPHLSALGEDVALSEALEWIRRARFKALEKDQAASLLVQGVIRFFNASDLLPHGAYLESITADGIMISNGDGAVVPIEEMSDGYRSVLAMNLEILRAMDTAYGREALLAALERGEPTSIDLPGVVLIDEVMHISTQLGKSVSASGSLPVFRKCSFSSLHTVILSAAQPVKTQFGDLQLREVTSHRRALRAETLIG
ncbi:hypothetical protein ACHFJ0_22095 [Paracoccus sp. NGMCC 1.201697]|uniref:Uncharacterized protein n=1 Tax=Paracoccus broussonetiae subsp. drimophilus TaxID=3373869 RepID=A0ABW7LRK4_9RHOB